MSGFFGIFNPKGSGINKHTFNQMKEAADRPGHDGLATYLDENIAMGHVMLRVSHESQFDQQPLKSSCGNYILVGHFRLDYRDELGDKLGLTQIELERTPDSYLAILSFIKWKEKCVHHLEGDWAFIVYDKSMNSLFVAKDPFGYSAIFYRKFQGQIYFSSSTSYLTCLDTLKNEINFNQFFRQSLPNVGPSESETLIKDLYSIERGSYRFFNSIHDDFKSFFCSFKNLNSIRYRYEIDYALSLSSFISLSVKSKIGNANYVGIFLSGGLDSTCVAHFAANELSARDGILNSYTSYPAYLDAIPEKQIAIANEVPLVKNFAQLHKNIDSKFYSFSQSKLSELLLSDYISDAYMPIVTPNSFWIDGILSEVRNDKNRIVLNGQLGNYTITPSASFIHSQMFLSFKFISLLRELLFISKKSSQSFLMTFRIRVIQPLWFQLSSYRKWFLFYYTSYYFSNSIFNLHRLDIKRIRFKGNNENAPFFSFIKSSRSIRQIQLLNISRIAGNLWYRDAEKKRVQVIDPTSDYRLILYSLSIPENEYNKRGKYKAVYQNLMRGRIPNDVLFNKNKMFQSYDIDLRFKNDNGIKFILDYILKKSHQISFMNLDKLSSLYEEIMSTSNGFSKYSMILQFLNYISLILFYFQINNIPSPKIESDENF
jgi:asparagine synthase (glutamine-hydrolysing)